MFLAILRDCRRGLLVALRDRQGVTAVATALAMTVLAGFAGIATDVAFWETAKRDMQGAADEAAYTAAIAADSTGVTGSSSSNCTAPCINAKGITAKMGYVDAQGGVTVVVNNPPSAGASAGSSRGWEVIVTKPQPMWFARVFMSTAPTASARAVALVNPGACVIALDPSAARAVSMNGSPSINMPCDMYVNSTSTDGTDVQGGGSITAKDVYLVGNYQTGGSSTVSGTSKLVTGASPVSDPYASRTMPSAGLCGVSPTLTGGSATAYSPSTSVTIRPGTYCGGISIGGHGGITVTMAPGVYFISQGGQSALSVGSGGTLNGTGVTIIFTDITCVSATSCPNVGGVRVDSNGTANLTAMSSGVTAGMAVWVDKRSSSTDTVTMIGGPNQIVNGAVYAPNAQITYGGSSSGNYCSQLVGRTISMSGSPILAHTCSALGLSEPPASSIAVAE